MLIDRIALHRFLCHDSFSLELPRAGLVLVTGPNGRGKSALIEAVSMAFWGETIRGTTPWHPKFEGSITVVAGELEVTRGRKAKKNIIDWKGPGAAPAWESPTHAGKALESMMGRWEIWRYSHVFRSADAMLFTLATDKARKQLLETILGLERFDRALQACRNELRAVERVSGEARTRRSALQGRLDAERRLLAEASEAWAQAPEPESTEEIDQLIKAQKGRIQAAEISYREAQEVTIDRAALDSALADESAIQARVGMISRQAQAIETRKACPTCGRPYETHEGAEQEKRRLLDELEQLRREASACKEKLAKAARDMREQEDARRDRINGLWRHHNEECGKYTELERQRSAIRERADRRKRLAEQLDRAKRQVESIEAGMAPVQAEVDQLARDHAELTAAEAVLGLKGVRAQMLAGALSGIEAWGNLMLARLAPERELRLRLGLESDAISLEVDGAGGGFGYRASSDGERRRIDLAIILAIGEVALAGRQPGTLWIDEALDGLDADGIAATSAVLAEMAAGRPVVVITHNSDLRAALKPRSVQEVAL